MTNLKMQVGAVEILALTDMNFTFPMPLEQLWPTVPAEAWAPFRELYPDTFDGEKQTIEIGCYLLRDGARTILIDTGYGAGPIESIGGLEGELMDNLAREGIKPASVDTVFLSHLHADHVGWNTVDVGDEVRPAFPNARYVAHQDDLAHFRRPEIQAGSSFPFMGPRVERLVELGLLDTLGGDTDLTPEIRAVHTPGHTPGHMSVMVSSEGHRALIQGDVLVHPAQVTEDGWNCHFDYDWPLSTETRRRMLDEVETAQIPVVSCHFPLPGFGRVVRRAGRRVWQGWA